MMNKYEKWDEMLDKMLITFLQLRKGTNQQEVASGRPIY